MSTTKEIRIEDILGRELLGGNNRPVGRIEEFRVHVDEHGCAVREVVIGVLGLLERMNLGARLVAGLETSGGRVARWDEIDFSNPSKPRLLVDVDTLVKL